MGGANTATGTAKTARPTTAGYVPRPHLEARLDVALDARAVWLAAPAGAGKTALVAGWLSRRRCRALWYQFDGTDADPGSFFGFLLEAAVDAGLPGARALPAFRDGADGTQPFARRFLRALAGAAGKPLILVLDDVHAIPAHADLLPALLGGAGDGSKRIGVVLMGRSEPPAALARARVAGNLDLIAASELRLAEEEARALIATRDLHPSPAALARLTRRADGWAAGLVVLIEEARCRGAELLSEDVGAAETLSPLLFDYLAGEVFDAFSATTQALLLELAHLPRLTATLARAFTETDAAPALLENLSRHHYFLMRRASEREQHFQWHELLREFLLRKGEKSLDAGARLKLDQRAARLLAEHGYVDDALEVGCAAADWAPVLALLARQAPALVQAGRSRTLVAWADRLPPALLSNTTTLAVQIALARARHNASQARRELERLYAAHQAGPADGESAQRLAVITLGILECILSAAEDYTALDPWCVRLAQALAEPSVGTVLRARAHAVLALSAGLRARPRPITVEASGTQTQDPAASAVQDEVFASRLPTAAIRALADVLGGALRQAWQDAPPGEAWVRVTAGIMVAERAALAPLANAQDDGLASTCLARAAAAAACGDRLSASAALAQAAVPPGAPSGTRLMRASHAFVRGWVAGLYGDVHTMCTALTEATALAEELGAPALAELAALAIVSMQTGTRDRPAASASFERATRHGAAHGLPRLARDLAYACIATPEHHQDAAAGAAQAALAAVASAGLVRLPAFEPQALSNLAAHALAHELEVAHVRTMITAGDLAPGVLGLAVERWPWQLRVRLLGPCRVSTGPDGHEPLRLQGRSLGLLQVLVALGPDPMPVTRVAAMMWPHMDGDYAHKSLTATLHRLRRALPDAALVVLEDAKLGTAQHLCWSDTRALELTVAAIERDTRRGSREAVVPHARLERLTDQLFDLYRGPLLTTEPPRPWLLAARERLHERFARGLSLLLDAWQSADRWARAIECCQRGVDTEPERERWHRRLVTTCLEAGRIADAMDAHERCRNALAARGTAPSAELESLRIRLRAAASGT